MVAAVDKFDRGRSLRWTKTNNFAVSSNSLIIFATHSTTFISIDRYVSNCACLCFVIDLIDINSSGSILWHYFVWERNHIRCVSLTPTTDFYNFFFERKFTRVGTVVHTSVQNVENVYIHIYTYIVRMSELSRSNLSSLVTRYCCRYYC